MQMLKVSLIVVTCVLLFGIVDTFAQTMNPELTLPMITIVPESEYVTSSPKTPLTSPNIIPAWNTPLILLLQNLEDLEIPLHRLVRVARGEGETQTSSASDVYYIGTDGKRHAFPTEAVYRSWYEEDPVVMSVPAWKLANIPLGKNVTYKPGKRILSFSDNRRYVVAPHRTLRPLGNEQIASILYGSDWMSFFERLPDAFFADYQRSHEGDVLTNSDFDPSSVQSSYAHPSQEMME